MHTTDKIANKIKIKMPYRQDSEIGD